MKYIFWITIGSLLVSIGCSSAVRRHSAAKKPKMSVRWVKSTLAQPYLGFRKLNAMKPVFWRDSVITGNAIDGISSFDRKTGDLLWRRNFPHGIGVGMSVVDDTIYFGARDSNFYALSAETGAIQWKYPVQSEGVGAPLVHQGRVYFIAGNHVLYALNAKDGKKIWTYNRRIRLNATIYGASRPTVRGERIYAGFSDGHLISLTLGKGVVVWDQTLKSEGRFKDVDMTPVIIYGRIYAASFDGSLFSLNLEGDILWKSAGGGASEILVTADRIFYSTTDAQIISLDRKSGKLLWERKNLKGYGTSPVLYKNLLLLGQTEGAILALNPDDGQTIASYSTGRGVSSAIGIDSDDSMFINTVNANLVSFRLDWISSERKWPWSY